jgi:hypothetical protein
MGGWTRPTRRPSPSARGPKAAPASYRSGKPLVDSLKAGCERRDSNPHVRRHRDLNPARLPVPPRSLGPRPGRRGIGRRGTGSPQREGNSGAAGMGRPFLDLPVPVDTLGRPYSSEVRMKSIGRSTPCRGSPSRGGGSPLQTHQAVHPGGPDGGTATRRNGAAEAAPALATAALAARGHPSGAALARAPPRCGTARSRRSGGATGHRHAGGYRGYPGREVARGGALPPHWRGCWQWRSRYRVRARPCFPSRPITARARPCSPPLRPRCRARTSGSSRAARRQR